jgi:hypothetical protein
VGLVAAAEALLRALSDFDPARHSGDDCLAVAEKLARTEKACAAARAMAAARAADAGSHRAKGFIDPVDWLARVSGTSQGEAQRELATAKRLEIMPATLAALSAGELSLAQAEEIARTERECPGAEREMLQLAQRDSLRTLRDEGRKKRLASIDVDELARRQRQARSFRHWRDELGMVQVHAALEPHVGIALVNRLDAETDRARRAAPRAERLATPWECSAADAFAAMITGAGKGHPTRADVVVVCDVASGASHIVGGGPVPSDTVREFLDAGAFVKAVLHDGVDVTHVRHYGKHPPAVLQTVIELGPPPGFDGMRCSVSGCSRRHHLERDHIDPRANGGAWSRDNVEPKCWYHHVEKTERDRKAGRFRGG